MKKIFSILLLLSIISCGTSKESGEKYSSSKNKILDIKEFNSAFVLKSLSQSGPDTVYIISAKKNSLKRQDVDMQTIKSNGVYNFHLSPVRFRTGTMQELGVYMIFENDTIYKGAHADGRKYFLSHNSVGLLIDEK